jgi:hypothetical protein
MSDRDLTEQRPHCPARVGFSDRTTNRSCVRCTARARWICSPPIESIQILPARGGDRPNIVDGLMTRVYWVMNITKLKTYAKARRICHKRQTHSDERIIHVQGAAWVVGVSASMT